MSRDSENGFGEWGGYMDAKISKLEEQFSNASDPFRQTNLFNGISIFVNGLTNPSSDELKRIMMVHGGIYHHYQRSRTMYIIASNLPDVKVRGMDTSNIISPQWVVDCVKEKKLLDYKKYLLYTNHKPSQPKIQFQKKKEESSNNGIDTNTEISGIFKELEMLNQKMNIKNAINENDAKLKELVDNKLEELVDEKLPSPEMFDVNDELNNGKPDMLGQEVKPENNKIPTTTGSKHARTAVDPNFLSEFYNNSRLHHIATLGAGFKQFVSELREQHSGVFADRDELKLKIPPDEDFQNYSQAVMHIDMDCFFVSVGLRTRPHLRGHPVAVTHSKGGAETIDRQGVDRQLETELYMKRFGENTPYDRKREQIKTGFEGKESLSEIASCSYEARQMGLRNGMFVGQALKLCPQLKTIPYDFDGYKEVAFTLYNTVAKYTLNIEAVSCDEMFVDLTDVLNVLRIGPMKFVEFLRNEVKDKTGCPCSAGIGSNRLQARMATKKAKPDGQFHLSPDIVEEYMSTIPISDLPGVGHSTSHTLKQLNWITCFDLRKIPLTQIQKEFGKKFGETLYQFCRGIDNRPLVYGQVRKSVSAEVNYGIRFTEFVELDKFLRQLCAEVHSRLTEIKRRGKCITLKLMVRSKEAPVESSKFMGHGYCDYFTKSTSLPDYTCDIDIITRTVLSIMKSQKIPPCDLRGIGIQITKLDNPNQTKTKSINLLKTMFSRVAEKKKEEVIETVDAVHENNNNIKVQTKKRKLPFSGNTSPNKKTVKLTIKNNRSKTKRAINQTNGVLNMLQNAAATGEESNDIEDIDPSVLAELPEDIRKEALRDHRRIMKATENAKNQTSSSVINKEKSPEQTSSKIQVDVQFLAALPPDLRKEVENEIALQNDKFIVTTNIPVSKNEESPKKPINIVDRSPLSGNNSVVAESTISAENILAQSEWRNLLQDWINSSDKPELYDVDLIGQHAQELVRAKRINDLYVPFKLLYRIINEKRICAWHKAYIRIYNALQSEMLAVYGSKMLLKDQIECDNNCTNL